MSPNYDVPAIDRTIMLLKAIAEHPRGISLARLTSETGIPKSSLFRIISTLKKHLVIVEDPEKLTYNLGMKLAEWGNAALERIDLKAIVHPYLVRLSVETKKSFYLAMLDDYEVIIVDRADTTDIWQIVTRLGQRSPIHCTASGMAMVSEMREEQLDEIIREKGLRKYTNKTIVTARALKKKLGEVRTLGYAVADGDYKPDLFALAAPIKDHKGKIVGSIMAGLHSDTARKSKKLVKSLIEIIVRDCAEISQRIGYKGVVSTVQQVGDTPK